MKLCVTGGRDYADRSALFEVLDATHALMPVTMLAHGAARGADSLAHAWAQTRNVEPVPYPADWNRHRKAGQRKNPAGPIRNRQMLLHFQPELVIAFPGGDGTADCVAAARSFGFVVLDLRETLRVSG